MTRTTIHGDRVTYQLTPPWKIGPNLEPAVALADGSDVGVWINPEFRTDEGRVTYNYEVRDPRGWSVDSDHFNSGVGAEPDLDKALSSLLSFAQANAEHIAHVERGGCDSDPLAEGHKALGRWYSEHENELMQYQDIDMVEGPADRPMTTLERLGYTTPGETVQVSSAGIPIPKAGWDAGEHLTDAEVRAAATSTVSLEGALTMNPDGSIRQLTAAEMVEFTAAVQATQPTYDPYSDLEDLAARGRSEALLDAVGATKPVPPKANRVNLSAGSPTRGRSA